MPTDLEWILGSLEGLGMLHRSVVTELFCGGFLNLPHPCDGINIRVLERIWSGGEFFGINSFSRLLEHFIRHMETP
jgi:hypothetical protein